MGYTITLWVGLRLTPRCWWVMHIQFAIHPASKCQNNQYISIYILRIVIPQNKGNTIYSKYRAKSAKFHVNLWNWTKNNFILCFYWNVILPGGTTISRNAMNTLRVDFFWKLLDILSGQWFLGYWAQCLPIQLGFSSPILGGKSSSFLGRELSLKSPWISKCKCVWPCWPLKH